MFETSQRHPSSVRLAAPPGAKDTLHRSSATQENVAWRRLATGTRVSHPHDPAEREADRAADAVLRGERPTLRGATVASTSIHRMCAECEEEQGAAVHAKRESGASAITGDGGSLSALEGRGQPMPATLKSEFEPRFGHDFGDVRLHTDSHAAHSAHAFDALAYTYGRHVVFGAGRFDPSSTQGRHLIAHELAHVVQQAGGGRASVQRQPKKDSPWSDWWPPHFKPVFPDAPFDVPGTKDLVDGCKLLPSAPGCAQLCKIYDCSKPPTSKTVCAPGFHGSTSTTFKDQCCKDNEAESAANCCAPDRIGDQRCCGEGEVADQGHCKKSSSIDPGQLCLQGQKAPSGECCLLPKVPGSWGCEEPETNPATATPLVFDAFVDRFEVLFNQDQPAVGQSFESSLANGRGELDLAIDELKKDLSTGVQLVANASKEGTTASNLDLTDRRLAAVRAEMADVSWKIRDPMPPMGSTEGCRGSWGAYSCGSKNADKTMIRDGDRNVILRLFRPSELTPLPKIRLGWPLTPGVGSTKPVVGPF